MHRRAILATTVAIITSCGWSAAGLAQETAVERPAEIRAGTCAALGDVVAPLTGLVVPSGEAQGQAGAAPVEQSVTTLPLVLDDLLAGGNAVVVQGIAEEAGTPVACGEIGGALSEDGTLAIGLYAVNGSRISGTAQFAPTADGGTSVTLLVIDERAGRRGDGSGDAAGSPAADPAVGGMTTDAGPATEGSTPANSPSAVDDASGTDNGVAPSSAAPAPAPATANLDGVATISASDEDGENAKPPRNKDKSTAERDRNGNAGTANTDSATSDGTGNRERDDDRGEREGGARAGEDGGANG